MLNTITSTELTHNTKAVIKQVIEQKQPLVILNYREPVAVVIEYNIWMQMKQNMAPRLNTINGYIRTQGKKIDSTKIIRKMRNEERI
jgi:PHD/YefM family antitoxin component YafN of YafNO toxin-antitoxin module